MFDGAKAYRRMEVSTADPLKLIQMLYEAALKQLFRAREGMKRGDVSAKCEAMSKAIAIIGELLASVSPDESNEAARFLRGLYTAILNELPRANAEDDVAAVELSIKYLAQLKSIWEEHVMAGGRETAAEADGAGRSDLGRSAMAGHEPGDGAEAPMALVAARSRGQAACGGYPFYGMAAAAAPRQAGTLSGKI